MKLTDLFFNRFLYKTPQSVETQDSAYLSGNQNPNDNAPVSSGDTVFDINTNSQFINGSQLNPNSPLPPGILNIANYGWTQTSSFTVASLNTVTWSAGTFTSADGTSIYSIGAGTTGVMAAKTYIYLDVAYSTTAYKISTDITDPIGPGKVLIAVAQNGPTSATYIPVQTTQIVSDNIIANSIAGNKIVAGSITATQISSSYIYAGDISADQITTGTLTGIIIQTGDSGQRVVLYSTLASYYDEDDYLICSTYAEGKTFWIKGERSDSSLYLGGGSGGEIAFIAGTTSRAIFDLSPKTSGFTPAFYPAVNAGMDLGGPSFNWKTVNCVEVDTANIQTNHITSNTDMTLNGDTIETWSDLSSYISLSAYMPKSGGTFTGDVSLGSNDLRVGGYIYLNSGNNNAYIYSSGNHTYVAAGGGGTLDMYDTDKTAIVPTSEGFNALYCMESPEVWFMDFCDEKGKLPEMFKEVTVGPYHYIKCGGGEYQVWGKRKGHEHKRFESKTEAEFDKNNEFYSMAKVT